MSVPGGTPATLTTADAAAPARDAADPLPRGTTIRHFVVLERIGAGGMGVVYAAYDYGLDRRIALKLVHNRGGRVTGGRTRLLREAQALAKLSHPNVVAVYDVGQHLDDVYVAMELIEGTSLRAWLAAERRDWRAIVEVFRRAGAGLAAAHAAGIIHRDVKPDNVVIARDGRLRVVDFGLALIEPGPVTGDGADTDPGVAIDPIAAPVASVAAAARAVTATGAAMGTPAYMAPEQHAGASDIDARADQFAFCVALYEALCGARPFAGDDGAALCAAIAAGRFEPPAAGRDVPAWLRRVVQRGLAAAPDARFPSMTALLAELDRDPARRRRRTALLGAAMLAVAGVGLGSAKLAGGDATTAAPCPRDDARLAGVWDADRRAAVHDAFARSGRAAATDMWHRVERALDDRAAAWQRMRIDACEATHLRAEQSSELLDLRMACLDDRLAELRALTDQLTTADRAAVGRALDAVRGLEPLDTCARGAALRAGGRRATDPGAAERRERLARAQSLALIGERTRALDLVQALARDAHAASDREIEGHARHAAGQLLTSRGELRAAEDALYDAVAAAQAAGADELAAKIWLDLLWLHGEAARPAEAHRFARVAQGAIDRVAGAPRLQAVLEDRVGVLLYNEARYAEAAPYLERGLALREQVSGAASTEAAASLQHLAILRTAEGRPDLALALHRRAREHAERALGPAHPDVLVYTNGEGAALFKLGQTDEAIALFERTLAALERAEPDNVHDATDLLSNIAVARRKRGELTAARTALERALALQEHERAGGPPTAREAAVLSNLGLALADLGLHDEARARLERALAIEQAVYGPDHPEVAETHSLLGSALMVADRPELAIAPIERAIALRAPLATAAHAVADDRFRLARALVRVGRDRRRALALADLARAAFAAEGDTASARAVDEWRATLGRGVAP